MRADAGEARRILGRIGVDDVRAVPGDPSSVAVLCRPGQLRAVKSRLMREGYSYQPRREPRGMEGGDWHVFKLSGRGGPPRNSRDLTRSIQRGEFDFFGGNL